MKIIWLMVIIPLLQSCAFMQQKTSVKICNNNSDTAFISTITTENNQELLSSWEVLKQDDCIDISRKNDKDTLEVLAVDNSWKKFSIVQTISNTSIYSNNKQSEKCIPVNTSGVRIPFSSDQCTQKTYSIKYTYVFSDTNMMFIQ